MVRHLRVRCVQPAALVTRTGRFHQHLHHIHHAIGQTLIKDEALVLGEALHRVQHPSSEVIPLLQRYGWVIQQGWRGAKTEGGNRKIPDEEVSPMNG